MNTLTGGTVSSRAVRHAESMSNPQELTADITSSRLRPMVKPRLKLLIVNYEFPPIGGGASFACLGLARTLVARGHRVEVLTSRLAGQPALEQIEGMLVHRVRSWRHGMHDCGLRGAATFLLFAWWRLRKL